MGGEYDRRDRWWRKAQEEGWRSRAAYKLLQIDERYGVIRTGDTVVDLGSAPGGWSQVALRLAGDDGRVVSVDRQGYRPVEGAEFVHADLTDEEDRGRVIEVAGDADVVVSDMSPNISGNYSVDVARSVHLAEIALEVASAVLRPGGRLVVKVFEGDLTPDYFEQVRKRFDFTKRTHPEASRDASSEMYVVAKGFRDEG